MRESMLWGRQRDRHKGRQTQRDRGENGEAGDTEGNKTRLKKKREKDEGRGGSSKTKAEAAVGRGVPGTRAWLGCLALATCRSPAAVWPCSPA